MKLKRILLLIIIIEILFIVSLLSGCTMPKTVTFAPLVQIRDSANGSANGDTVTPVAP